MGAGRLKFMLVGLPKSGSCSIYRALKWAGLVSRHDANMCAPIYRNWKRRRDIMRGQEQIEAITELVRFGNWRTPFLLQFDRRFLLDLRSQYDVGFLLNTRERASLVSSISRWRPHTRQHWISADLPFLPAGVGESDQDFIDGIDRHYDMLRETFADDPLFRECDIADPAMPKVIGSMIGRKLPWWGRVNVNHRNPAP